MPRRIKGIIFITAGNLRSSSVNTLVAFSNNLSINPFSTSLTDHKYNQQNCKYFKQIQNLQTKKVDHSIYQ